MEQKKQYYGVDVVKFILALLVAGRHMIQVFYPAESRWRLIIVDRRLVALQSGSAVFLYRRRISSVSENLRD